MAGNTGSFYNTPGPEGLFPDCVPGSAGAWDDPTWLTEDCAEGEQNGMESHYHGEPARRSLGVGGAFVFWNVTAMGREDGRGDNGWVRGRADRCQGGHFRPPSRLDSAAGAQMLFL